MVKISLGLAIALAFNTSFAAKIAVVDSGTDYLHQDLETKIWSNEIDNTENDMDEDDNGLKDDIRGWNFANNNNKVIEHKYKGTFTRNIYK